jgi:AraC family transcriptional regulator, regulatory protein of adaptative response / methylated-DNA-[protein]-cysteine methyltransferase
MEEPVSMQLELAPDALWRAVIERDKTYDGAVFYAVRTTGVFCRPSCASRKPSRENVSFFFSAEGAVNAGYRPCRRCRPQLSEAPDTGTDTVLALCRYLETAVDHVPTLSELAGRVGLSASYTQRLFKDALGISPRQYAVWLRRTRFRRALHSGEEIASAAYGAGYGSSSRIYEDNAAELGMTPGQYRNRGGGQLIFSTMAPCRLGFLLVASTGRGICAVKLGDSHPALTAELEDEFSSAQIQRADSRLVGWVNSLVEYLDRGEPMPNIPVDIQATAFQQLVWDFLRKIPAGETRSYGEVASKLGHTKAARAVGAACAANPVALVIPCHRVVRGSGGLGGYRWGLERKKKLLELEFAGKGNKAEE